jgi:hypothetical protein
MRLDQLADGAQALEELYLELTAKGDRMNAVVRWELLKQRTTRTILELPLWVIGVVALFVLLHGFGRDAATLTSHDGQLKVLGWGTSVGARGAARRAVNNVRNPPRHYPPDIPRDAQARAGSHRQSGRECTRRSRDWPARRGG